MTHRILVLLWVAVLGAAAPARAWCEASCLAPAAESQSHCPTHEPAPSGTTISGSAISECPATESARPTAPSRLDAQAALVVSIAPAAGSPSPIVPSTVPPHAATTVFERCTPLRI